MKMGERLLFHPFSFEEVKNGLDGITIGRNQATKHREWGV